MAPRGNNNRSGIRRLLQSVCLLLIPLTAHGEPSLAAASRRTVQRNQSSVSVLLSEALIGRRTALSDDSAERDHLIGAGLALGAGPPLSAVGRHDAHRHARLDFSEEEEAEPVAGGGGHDDIVTAEFRGPAPSSAPSDPSPDWTSPPRPLRQRGGDPTAWTLSDFYDYLSPDDDLSALDTTPDPEPTPSPLTDMADENPLLIGSTVAPDNDATPSVKAPPTPAAGPGLGLGGGGVVVGGDGGCGLGFVRSDAGACVSQCDGQPDFCLNGGVCTVAVGIGAFCRCNVQEYIWNKGSRCDWSITEFQVMCLVVGVASLGLLLLFMVVVFFAKRLLLLSRENRQLRKRSSKYCPQSEPQTDGFSVSTVTDGSHPNVRKLCDSPAHPPQAHAHNLAYYDNIICQTPVGRFTRGFKPRQPYCQDDPQKLEDPVKAPPPKEEESLNIRNSHSPKHENNRPASVVDPGHAPNNTEEEAAEDGVTIGLELLLPKEARLRPQASPPLHYNVFLYKLPNNNNNDNNDDNNDNYIAAGDGNATQKPRPSTNHAPQKPRPQASPGRHAAAPHGHGSSPPLRRPRGRSGTPSSSSSLRPSPSSPLLPQPPSSPSSSAEYRPLSTRSLPYAL